MKGLGKGTLLWSAWLYLGGPAVWSAWMVLRLRLFTVSDFLRCLWPVGSAILVLFSCAHLINLRSAPGRRLPRHFLILALFGSAGTYLFLGASPALGLPGPWDSRPDWSDVALRGAMAGGAMIALFYPLPNTLIFKGLVRESAARELRRLNLASWIIGLPAWFTAGLIGRPPGSLLSTLASLLLPAAMSSLLLLKVLRGEGRPACAGDQDR